MEVNKVRYDIKAEHLRSCESIKTLINDLGKLFRKIKKAELIEINFSALSGNDASYHIIDEVMKPFVQRKNKKGHAYGKYFFISDPCPVVRKTITVVLDKYGMVAILKEGDTFQVIGNAFHSHSKKGKPADILDFINKRGHINTIELSEHLRISSSLASYKLNKLFVWSLITREKFIYRGGGRGFMYFPLQLDWKIV